MSDAYEIQPVPRALSAWIRPPGSKSLTNRALVCAALAAGRSELRGVLDSEDTRVMVRGLQELGIAVEVEWRAGIANVCGCGGRLPDESQFKGLNIDLANSGTSMRFLTAVLTALGGEYILTGTDRMRQRPIGDLVEALSKFGGGVEALGTAGTPPVHIRAQGLRGGPITIDASASSQFVSALMLAAPLAMRPVEIAIAGRRVSRPYIRMTQRVMEAFGVEVRMLGNDDHITIEPQIYQPADYPIEPDASAASYFFAAAAVVGGTVTVTGLSRQSLQGDIQFVDCLEQMGCQVAWLPDAIQVTGPAGQGIDCDMTDISDTAQTLAAVALFVDSPTTIRGIAHNRWKETDRVVHLAVELRRLGARVDVRDDGLTIYPGPLRGAVVETYNDHRMAMSLALVGLRIAGIAIRDPACVGKTYPGYFDDLRLLCKSTND